MRVTGLVYQKMGGHIDYKDELCIFVVIEKHGQRLPHFISF